MRVKKKFFWVHVSGPKSAEVVGPKQVEGIGPNQKAFFVPILVLLVLA